MTSAQRKQLRALAHHLDPVVFVGKQGLTDGVITAIVKALAAHELIKVRFLDCKEEKRELTDRISAATGSDIAGIIGHVAILYKEHPDPEKREIELD
jgi:RNA-binding protein